MFGMNEALGSISSVRFGTVPHSCYPSTQEDQKIIFSYRVHLRPDWDTGDAVSKKEKRANLLHEVRNFNKTTTE